MTSPTQQLYVNKSYVYVINEWKAVAEAGDTSLVGVDAFS